MLNPLSDQFIDLSRMESCGPCNIGCTGADRQLADIENRIRITVRRGRGFHAGRGAGRKLATGHAVDVVVHDDIGHINVATASMDEVVTADCRTITITTDTNNRHFRLGHFYSGRKSGGAAMSGMQGAGINITRQTAGTADTGNESGLVPIQLTGIHGPDQSLHDNAMTATGTPDMRQLARTDRFFVIVSH